MMPQIEKLVPVDGRLGIVLDIPLDRFGEGSVSIYSEQEVKDLIERTKRDEREAIIERIIERIGKTGQCQACLAWDCAKSVAETIRSES